MTQRGATWLNAGILLLASMMPGLSGFVPDAAARSDAEVAASQLENFSFRSPVQERRFHSLLGNMRCLDNPDQSLLESNAPIAGEMRSAVYRMLQDDRVDFEIRNAMVERYGDEALYQSAFPGHRLLLQVGPVVLLVLGLIAAFIVSMRKRQAAR